MRAIAFARLEAEILSLYDPPLCAPATRREMRQVLREFGEVPGVRRSSDLRPPAIATWIKAHPGRSSARVESLLRCLRVICNYAVNQGFLTSSPFGFRPLKSWIRPDIVRPGKAAPPRYKTAAEIGRLLRQVDAESALTWSSRRLQALVYTYVFTAFRRDEALHLLSRNIDLDRRTVRIEPLENWRPKTVRSSRTLPLADPLTDVLRLWLPMCGSVWLFPGTRLKGPWTGGSPGYKAIDQIKAAARRAGIPDCTILGFRKSFGTNSKAMGLGDLERRAIFGHTNDETGDWYDEETVETLRPAMRKIQLYYATGS